MTIEAARLAVVVDSDTSGAERGLGRMSGVVSGAAGTLGTLVTAAGAMATGVGIAGAAAGVELDSALTPIGTLLGRTTPEFRAMQDALTDFMAASPLSADEIGNAAYMTLSAGITDTGAAMDVMRASQQLALAGLGDLAGANDLVTSAMNSFVGENLSADQAAKILFGTIASGKTTTGDLAQGFGAIAPLAASAGVGFTDLMAATAALTATGQPASVAYSGLKAAISNVIKPTADAAETAKKLGLDFSQAHLAAVGLPAFLDEIKTATGGNVETMAALFGSVEGLNAVLALTGPQADAFESNMTNIGTAGEALGARAAEVEGNVSNRFKSLKNNVQTHLGEAALQVFGWVDAAKAAFDGEGITSDGITGMFERVGVFARRVVDDFRAHWPQIRATALEVFGRVQTVAGQLVEWFRANWPQIRATAEQVIDRVGEVITWVTTEVIPRAQTVLESIVSWVRENWPQISATITEVLQTVQTVVTGVMDLVSTIWRNYGEQILQVAEAVWQTVLGVIDGALDVIRGVVDTVMGVIHGDWGRAWEGIKSIVGGVWTAIKALVSGALDVLKAVVEVGWDLIKGVMSRALDGLKLLVGQAWDGIKSGVSTAVDGIKSAVSNAFTSAKDAAVTKSGELLTWVGGLPGKITEALGSLLELLKTRGRDLLTGLLAGAIEKALDLADWAKGLPAQLLGWIGNLNATLRNAGKDLVRGFIDGIGDMAQAVLDKAKSVIVDAPKSLVKNALGIFSPSRVYAELGGNVAAGFAEGVEGGASSITSQLTALTTVPAVSAPTFASSRSQSNVFHLEVKTTAPVDGRTLFAELVRFARANGVALGFDSRVVL